MVHTVGIVGVSGNVGKPTTKLLAQAAEHKKVKLVVLHREGSDLEGVRSGENIELRTINFGDPIEKLAVTLKGINVLVSTIAFAALNREVQLVEALAKSPDIVTYIPALISSTWDKEDWADAEFSRILNFASGGIKKARENNIGVTQVYSGVFDFFFYEIGYLGSPINGNTIYANEGHLKNCIPITTMGHLSQALTDIATSDPQSIKDKAYSIVTFTPTGQELVDLYTKLNGSLAQVKSWNPEAVSRLSTTPIQRGYVKHWENNTFEYESGDKIVYHQAYRGPGLEEVARQYVKRSAL